MRPTSFQTPASQTQVKAEITTSDSLIWDSTLLLYSLTSDFSDGARTWLEFPVTISKMLLIVFILTPLSQLIKRHKGERNVPRNTSNIRNITHTVDGTQRQQQLEDFRETLRKNKISSSQMLLRFSFWHKLQQLDSNFLPPGYSGFPTVMHSRNGHLLLLLFFFSHKQCCSILIIHLFQICFLSRQITPALVIQPITVHAQ